MERFVRERERFVAREARRPLAPRGKTPWGVGAQKLLCDALFRGRRVAEFEALVGYRIDDLRRCIERQFRPGMDWNNHASSVPLAKAKTMREGLWVIDHIVPKCTFTASDARHCFALTNLRPLWMTGNCAKGIQRTHLI